MGLRSWKSNVIAADFLGDSVIAADFGVSKLRTYPKNQLPQVSGIATYQSLFYGICVHDVPIIEFLQLIFWVIELLQLIFG